MRTFTIIPLVVAVLLAAPISGRPTVQYTSDVDTFDRPLQVSSNRVPTRPRVRKDYDAHGAVDRTTHALHRMQHYEARELARLVVRAMEESEELYARKFEELERRSMSSATKKKITGVLDILEERKPAFTWDVNWTKAHDANTSQLEGYKPASRKDSAAPHHYHVALFETSGKKIKGNPIIQASFAGEPTSMADIVAALKQALAAA